MQIDSHRRCSRYDAALEPHLGANGIAATVAVHADRSEDETNFQLRFSRENRAERNPGVAGWVDLRAPNLPARLEYFWQFEGLRGFRHTAQGELDERFLPRDDFCRGASWLREFGFTCDIPAYARQLPAAVDWNRWSPELFEPYLGLAFDAFGADRLMFGSDCSSRLLAGSYHRVKGLVADSVRGLPEAEQSKIFAETTVFTV